MADRSLNHDAPKSILRREGVKRPCAAEGQQVLGAAVLAAHAGDPHGIVKGLAHITGGGLVDNLPHVLPKDCDAVIDTSSWKTRAIFEHIERCSGVVQLRH